jgi:ferric-dicitrate binding protein FerR (iron transport regulator)
MQTRKFQSLLRKIEADEVTNAQLSKLFHTLLKGKLTARQQLALCRQLAQQQHDYAATDDPRLEGWITQIKNALKAAGAHEHIIQEVSAALFFGTYLHDVKFAQAPAQTDATPLTVSLHIALFGKNPLSETDREDTSILQLVVAIIARPGAFISISVALISLASVLLMFIHHPVISTPVKCPKNSVTVSGKRPLSLPDGSALKLNTRESALCYSYPFYSDGRREAGLRSGSVYFDIAADAQNPFFINAQGGVVTEASGGCLNLTVDPENQTVEIAIAKGTALVHYDEKTFKIIAGQQLSIDLVKKALSVENFIAEEVAWPYPWLSFENVTLEEFARRVEHHFNVAVVFSAESLKAARFTADFRDRNIELSEITHMLEAVMGNSIKFKLKDNTLTIRKKR